MEIKEVLKVSRESLKNNWGLATGTSLIIVGSVPLSNLLLVLPIPRFLVAIIFIFLFLFPLSGGFSWIFLGLIDGKQQKMGNILDGFKHYSTFLKLSILRFLFVFFWQCINVDTQN